MPCYAMSSRAITEDQGVEVVAAIMSLSGNWPADLTAVWGFIHGQLGRYLGNQ